jgi:hypothetical protein
MFIGLIFRCTEQQVQTIAVEKRQVGDGKLVFQAQRIALECLGTGQIISGHSYLTNTRKTK